MERKPGVERGMVSVENTVAAVVEPAGSHPEMPHRRISDALLIHRLCAVSSTGQRRRGRRCGLGHSRSPAAIRAKDKTRARLGRLFMKRVVIATCGQAATERPPDRYRPTTRSPRRASATYSGRRGFFGTGGNESRRVQQLRDRCAPQMQRLPHQSESGSDASWNPWPVNPS